MVEKWERADVGGLLASQDQNQGDVWAWAAARFMSGSVAQLHPESMFMFMDPDAIKGHADTRGLGHHLGLCWCLRTMLLWVPCQSEWPVLLPESLVTSEPKLLPKTMSGFCGPTTAGFRVDVRAPWYYPNTVGFLSVAHSVTKGHIDACV